MSRTLSVSVVPLQAGEWIANTPPCLRYSVGQEPPQERRARGDYRVTNELFNRLQDVRVGESSLFDIVSVGTNSLWQFLPSYIWPSVFRAVELADVLTAVGDEHRPTALVCDPVGDETNAIWIGVASAFAARRGIPMSVRPARSSLASRGRDLARRSGLGLLRAGWRTSRLRSRLADDWVRRPAAAASAGRTLLWAARARDWVPQPGSPLHHDEHLHPLLPALRRAGWQRVVGIDCPYGAPDFVASRFESRLREPEPGIEWRPYFHRDDGAAEAARAARRILAGAWTQLNAAPSFHETLQHRGIPLGSALSPTFARAFRHALPDCAGQLAAASATIDRVRPDAVMAVYENGPFARALLIEAGRRGIPSLGLQHGTIFPNHYDYMHRRIVPASLGGDGFVVPDVTCVWGPAWRETLIQAGHYPPDAVAVTGYWRYDDLPGRLAAIDRGGLRVRLGLRGDAGVAAILSSGQATVDFVSASLDAIERRADLVPLIRLHPSDDPSPVEAELRRRGMSAAMTPVDLVELLALSRVVISQWSTVVAEAALADRPIVLVNLLRLPGAEAFVEAGICVPVEDAAAIAPALDSVLDDAPVAARLEAARASFVERYFHGTDGRAAERVAAALEGVISRRRPHAEVSGG